MPEVHNPVFARLYHRVLRPGEGEQIENCRREMLEGLHGEVVEVGAGDGANFALYPPEVTRVVALEPEPYLREQATRVAQGAGVPVEVRDGVAERLPLPDDSADAVVFALVLCSVADPSAALAEARRVLRIGGQLRVFEHVVSGRGGARAMQRAAQATFWPHLFGNCHPARDTLATIRDAGYLTEELRSFTLRPSRIGLAMPVLLGRAELDIGRAWAARSG